MLIVYFWMCYIDGQKNKYSVLNECNRMLKYNILDHPVPEGYIYEDLALQVGSELDYHHRSPASRKGKGTQCPRV
jgi:hypothetical protein